MSRRVTTLAGEDAGMISFGMMGSGRRREPARAAGTIARRTTYIAVAPRNLIKLNGDVTLAAVDRFPVRSRAEPEPRPHRAGEGPARFAYALAAA